jgi:hypothetical protein
MLLTTPRKFFLFPFIMAACFVPMNQRFIIFDLDFTILRILTLFGILRLVFRNETREVIWNTFDKLIVSWSIVGSVIYIIQVGNTSGFIYKSGVMFDCLGMYWLFRQTIRNWDDINQTIRMFAFFAIITAPIIGMEKIQQSSYFSVFGPVQGQFHRQRYRCAGPFPHYIMMGTFWAVLLPLFYAQIKAKKHKILYFIAISAAISNVYLSASSTPIMTTIAIILFWYLYEYRMHGKKILWASIFVLFSLHLIMKAPVWHLMARADIFAGSTGWHRYYLFDNFIKNFSEWFLIGTRDTAHWGRGLNDITNQFVLEAVRGGFITLVLFTIIIYNAIKIPGRLSLSETDSEKVWILWAICVAMLGHFFTFWGVSFFGQINMLLYLTFTFVAFSLENSINPKCNENPFILTTLR